MSFNSWLQNLRSALAPGRGQRHQGRRGSLRAATHRPNLEVLEDRLTPSVSGGGEFPVGPNPAAVATTDFNNDGRLDLATANHDNSTVSILLGDGQGGFSTARNFATGASPSSLAVGDFNGDGKPDLVTANSSLRYVSVLLGNGDGTFRAPVTTDTTYSLAGYPLFMAAANCNGGATTDLVFATTYTPYALDPGSFPVAAVEVLWSTGQGWFGSVSTRTEVALDVPTSLVVADLNGDGKADAVTTTTYYDDSTASYTGLVSVLLTNVQAYGFQTNPYSQAVAAGDFTRDGIPDLVITGEPMAWDGTMFGGRISTSTSNNVADFNGDGALDIDSGESFALGLGDGTFTAPLATGIPPAIGDFNRDGRPDEAYAEGGSNLVSVQLNDGAWPPLPPIPPAFRIGDASVTEGNTGTTAANFLVTLSAPSTETITVDYTTGDGTATADSDYQAAGGTLTFAPGETSKTVTVLVNGDREGEFDEYFFVYLTGATNAIVAGSGGAGTIADDEPRITTNYRTSHSEGNTGQTPFAFGVNLSSAYDVPVTVNWTTADGSATAGSDYRAASGTLTIPSGQTTGTITVLVNGDRLSEPTENFYVNLSGATHATIIYGFSEGMIQDDEPRISISDVTRYEGKKGKTTQFSFTVTLSAAYDQAVTMSFKTTDGTAKTSDSDYVARTGTLTFAPGETTKTITIDVKGDSKREANETFYLDLFGNSGNSLFTYNRGFGTILNDD